jgi:tetratricopeptide (TPR) repeat protein
MLATGGEAVAAALDREERNLQAALDWSVAHDAPTYGLRILGAAWRWFQGRGRLREARATVLQLLERAPSLEPTVRIAGLAAAGGLAYWMRDFPAARDAYEERLALAEATGDTVLIADAHYDLGYIGMVSQDDAMLRTHEERALELYTAAGREEAAVRTREALVLSLFLGGEYRRACELETLNVEAFERAGSQAQVASGSTLLAAIEWRAGDVEQGWRRLLGAMSVFHALEQPPGLVRTIGLASIMLLSGSRSEAGARAAGATYRLVRERGLMLGPVHVLHLPEPSELADARFGPERAAALLAEGEAMTIDDVVAALAASPPPAPPIARRTAADTASGA